MIKCANCESSAVYTVAEPSVDSVNYCSECLPRWLLPAAAAGSFALVKPEEEKPKAAKKKVEAVVEEAPVNEDH